MLHKCANSSCSNQFRRVSEGKLFQVETDYFESGLCPESDVPVSKARRRVEYFWLCGQCSSFLSLSFDKTHGVMTVPATGNILRKTVTGVRYAEPIRSDLPLSDERTG
jgi:hypothetical protein